MLDVCIYDGLRTPFGRHAGVLAAVRPDDLIASIIRELVDRCGFAAAAVEDVILGCAAQSGEDSRNIARHAALLAGLPPSVPGQTVNRLCGSGLAAVLDGARMIRCGEGDLVLAGGVESMSRAPYILGKSESAWSRNVELFDSTIGARFPNPKLIKLYGNESMPETGDNIAKLLNITREASDQFALASQQRYAAALKSGFFEGEIHPIQVPSGTRNIESQLVELDEHPRPLTNLDSLTRLKPLFGGVVTAGNASGINDGAAVLLLGSRAIGESAGIAPKVRVLSGAVAGVEPGLMGLGPALAIPKALQRAGLTLADMDVIEINEAFAPQVLGCLQQLEIGFDDSRVNPNGGAIALGHPLGASGVRLALTAARQLEKCGGRYAVVSLCIGVGQGIAMVIESL